ncbi:hypothetical protein C0Q70_02532 [Pomacea canaliculata]|uniref:Cadherin domain-containing protein n=1 Tax=Pomacea canaliculata TaxID=400727 RepID=A0A2T7PQ71_POMCA|nr:hypothetical protein C0Q70_02532 [Pomacea canaliculata]
MHAKCYVTGYKWAIGTTPGGVLAILENPALDDIGVQMNGTEELDPDTRPVTSRKSNISIGSQKEGRCCDILPRTLVATNMSGVVSIRNGCLYINDEKLIDLRNSHPGANGSDTAASPSDFQMAPGSELFLYVDACNEARCTGPEMKGSVLIVGDHSEQAVSRNGSSVQLALSTARRQKRSTSNIVINTPNGMAVGQTVVLTPLTHADLNATYDSVASTDFVSYLTNPEDTVHSVDTVDRILAHSICGASGNARPFTVTYPYDPSDSDSVLTLLHWNPDLQKWQQSADTCNKTDSIVIDEASQTITVKVCSTYGTSTYFVKQTQFLLSAVSKNISNSEPVLTSSTNLTMKEDEGTFLYKVQTSDEDGDTVIVQLHDVEPLSPDQGELLLAQGNLVLFTPCADCSGTYLIQLLLKESPVTGILPATATTTLTVDVTAVNDAPVAFTFHNGKDLMPPDHWQRMRVAWAL